MFAAEYRLEIKQGEEFNVGFYLMDDNDQPISLADYSFQSQLREFPESDIYHEFTITTVPEQGYFAMHMTPEETSNIMFDNGVYDIFYTNNLTGVKLCLLQGDVKIYKQVTR